MTARASATRTARELARQDRQRGRERAVHDPLHPEIFSLALDTREQIVGPIPLDVPVVVGKLPFGDLSVVGFESMVAIDRKQIGDFIGCVTWEKERFTRLLVGMAAMAYAAIVVETTVADVRAHRYRADVAPGFVIGAAAKISTKYGIPVFFVGSLEASTDFSVRLLRAWWRERGASPLLRGSDG